jgi:hypothetical protein
VGREEVQQLELLVGEIERLAVHLGRVGRLVDRDARRLDAASSARRLPSDREPDARVDFGGAGGDRITSSMPQSVETAVSPPP